MDERYEYRQWWCSGCNKAHYYGTYRWYSPDGLVLCEKSYPIQQHKPTRIISGNPNYGVSGIKGMSYEEYKHE